MQGRHLRNLHDLTTPRRQASVLTSGGPALRPQRSGRKSIRQQTVMGAPRRRSSVGKGSTHQIVRLTCLCERRRAFAAAPSNALAWRATATLTKGQVDTFLFVRFPYAQPLDLRAADLLVLDTSVPEAQRTSTQLLVILHQQNGADYYAATGRLLGAAGRSQLWIPLNRFQLAGWSRDPSGHLDLSSITELRVGWGGYYSGQGEKIEFSLAPVHFACDTATR